MASSKKSFVNFSPPTFNADDLNGITQETNLAISSANINLNQVDNFQTAQGVRRYCQSGDFFDDNGTADNYILVLTGQFFQPRDYTEGQRIRFIPVNSSTGGTVKVNIVGKPVLTVLLPNGQTPALNTIQVGIETAMIYRQEANIFELTLLPGALIVNKERENLIYNGQFRNRYLNNTGANGTGNFLGSPSAPSLGFITASMWLVDPGGVDLDTANQMVHNILNLEAVFESDQDDVGFVFQTIRATLTNPAPLFYYRNWIAKSVLFRQAGTWILRWTMRDATTVNGNEKLVTDVRPKIILNYGSGGDPSDIILASTIRVLGEDAQVTSSITLVNNFRTYVATFNIAVNSSKSINLFDEFMYLEMEFDGAIGGGSFRNTDIRSHNYKLEKGTIPSANPQLSLMSKNFDGVTDQFFQSSYARDLVAGSAISLSQGVVSGPNNAINAGIVLAFVHHTFQERLIINNQKKVTIFSTRGQINFITLIETPDFTAVNEKGCTVIDLAESGFSLRYDEPFDDSAIPTRFEFNWVASAYPLRFSEAFERLPSEL